MAVQLENPEAVSDADGVVTTFDVGFTFEATAEVVVEVEANGARVLQVEGDDYQITGSDFLSDGGQVVFQPGRTPAAGARVVRWRRTAPVQSDALGDTQRFQPALIERLHDRQVRMVQEDRRDIGRAVKAPAGEAAPTLPGLAERIGQILGTNAAGGIVGVGDLAALAGKVLAVSSSGAALVAAAGLASLPMSEFGAVVAMLANAEEAADILNIQPHYALEREGAIPDVDSAEARAANVAAFAAVLTKIRARGGGAIALKPGKTYHADASVTGDFTDVAIIGDRTSVWKFHSAAAGAKAFVPTGSRWRFQGFKIQGIAAPGVTPYAAFNSAIYCNQAVYSPSFELVWTDRPQIVDMEICNFADHGVRGDYWREALVRRNYFHDLIYAGFGCSSFIGGSIEYNEVEDIGPGYSGTDPWLTAYGLYVSRDSNRDLAEAPASTGWRMIHNRVKRVYRYTAYDAHAGASGLIAFNYSEDCHFGVNLEHNDGPVDPAPAEKLRVVFNHFVGNDGTTYLRGPGVVVEGAGSTTQRDILVGWNTIEKHGCMTDGADSGGVFGVVETGAIYVEKATGVQVIGNYLKGCTKRGVVVGNSVFGALVADNTIEELEAYNSVQIGIDVLRPTAHVVIRGNRGIGSAGSLVAISAATPTAGYGAHVDQSNTAYGGMAAFASSAITYAVGGTLRTAPVAQARVTGATGAVAANSLIGALTVTRNTAGQFDVDYASGTFPGNSPHVTLTNSSGLDQRTTAVGATRVRIEFRDRGTGALTDPTTFTIKLGHS